MYDGLRLSPIFRVFGVLLLSLMLANVGLVLFTAAFPGWLPRQFFGLDFVSDNRQRAVAAAAQLRDGIVDPDEPWVLILGLSSASEGIVLEDLRGQGAGDSRYLALCGAGRNMQEVAIYADPLLESAVRPELAVFAISPFHLVDPPPLGEGFIDNLKQRTTRIELLGLWFYSRRGDVKHAVEVAVLAARHALFDVFDVRIEETGPDPWREIVRMGMPQLEGEEEWQAKLRQYGLRGYYDPQRYLRSRDQAAALVGLVARFRERGSEVVIVLMPEHSTLREQIPPEALAALREPLETGGELPPIVDLRDAVPDSGFADISHMNEAGRLRFTPLLAAAIRER